MPHYKNGREAKVGDQVLGRGYNVKHIISGVVVGITPGAECCNVEIAHAKMRPIYREHALPFPAIDIESGEAKRFEHVEDVAAREAAELDTTKRDELAGEVRDTLKDAPL